jgi:POTRA domain, FtsQ-type
MIARLTKAFRRRRRPGNFRRARRPGRPVQPAHVLDVQVDSSREKRRRRGRQWLIGLKYGALGGAVVLIAGAARSVLARNFWLSQELLVRGADIQTDGTLSHEEIMRHAGLSETTHVYDVDLRAVRERLEVVPAVRHAAVERELPGRLVIHLEERQSVAWLACDSPLVEAFNTNPRAGGCLLDAEGYIFLCTELRPELMKLPVIHVSRLPNTQPGVHVTAEPVQAGLALLDRVRRQFGPRGLDVVEIDSPNEWSLVVKFSDDTVVTFGYDDLDGQLARLTRVLDISAEKSFRLGTVNLLPRKNVPVTIVRSTSPRPAAEPAAPVVPASGSGEPVATPDPKPEARPSGLRSRLPDPQLEEILGRIR